LLGVCANAGGVSRIPSDAQADIRLGKGEMVR